jgi:hypothetical protein
MIVARHEVPGFMRKIARPRGRLKDLGFDWTPTYLSTGIPGVSKAA